MKLCLFLMIALAASLTACSSDEETAGEACDTDVSGILDASGNTTLGETTYTSLCGTSDCHGPGGNDGDEAAGDLPTRVPELTEEQLARTIKCGIGEMPAQSPDLDDQDIANVMAYVRDTFQ